MVGISAVLFDKDGVLVDFDRTWAPALKVIAAELANGDAARRVELLEVAGYDAVADVFLPGSVWAAGNTSDLVEVWLPDGSAAQRAEMAGRIEAYCLTCDAVPLFPPEDLRAMFQALRDRGYRLGIATNDMEASARKTVDVFGLGDHLELVMGYDSVENPKPAPDPVHRFAGYLGVDVSAVAMVGDNLHDAEMARAAGAGLAIGVLSGNASRQQLSGHVDHVLDDISMLEALLESL